MQFDSVGWIECDAMEGACLPACDAARTKKNQHSAECPWTFQYQTSDAALRRGGRIFS
jgi:hypothetical protein